MADYQYNIQFDGIRQTLDIDAPTDATEYYTVFCGTKEIGFIYPEQGDNGVKWEANDDRLTPVAQELGEYIAMANLKF